MILEGPSASLAGKFSAFIASDVDDIHRSAHGTGIYLKPDVDSLYFDDLALSNYCHKIICKGLRERAKILSSFKEALNAAWRIRWQWKWTLQELGARVSRARHPRQYQICHVLREDCQSFEVCLPGIRKRQEPP